MAEWEDSARADYKRKGFAMRTGYGKKPVLLIVDFINAFTDPTTPLGGDFTAEIQVTSGVLEVFRTRGLPVVFTVIAYQPDLRDGGMWVRKISSAETLIKGTPMVEVDDRIRPRTGEYVLEKKMASAFFGTALDGYLAGLGVDTVIMAGCTTSGCIRASAIDSMSYGYHTVVVADAVGDRAEGPHEANLFDIESKYGDVVPATEVIDYLRALATAGGYAAEAAEAFDRWWSAPAGVER